MPWAGGHFYDDQVCGGETGEEKWSGSCTVEGSGTEGTKAARNRLLSVAYTATWDLSCSQGPCLGSLSFCIQHLWPLLAPRAMGMLAPVAWAQVMSQISLYTLGTLCLGVLEHLSEHTAP